MIGHLRGIIIEKHPPSVLLEVGGIGYEINAPMSTFYHLPNSGQEVLLYTHFIVREDVHQLYGFYTQKARELFRSLLKVNGVGPRLALTILSSMNPDEFSKCVANNDVDSLIALPGVGKKTAERLLIEMRDRIPQDIDLSHVDSAIGAKRSAVLQDAIAALISLGFKAQLASRTVAKLDDGNSSSEEIIRRALQEGVT